MYICDYMKQGQKNPGNIAEAINVLQTQNISFMFEYERFIQKKSSLIAAIEKLWISFLCSSLLYRHNFTAEIFIEKKQYCEAIWKIAFSLRRKVKKTRFWVRRGRASIWGESFFCDIVLQEKWSKNFRMSIGSFFDLCDELCPFVTKNAARFHSPVSVEKWAAVTLY